MECEDFLKTKLKYSYKKNSLIKLKSFMPNQIRKFIESALVQAILIKNYELIFLDEFSVNYWQKSVDIWVPIGSSGFQQSHNESFWISFMIGLSIKRIYELFGSKSTHDHKSFITFISNVSKYKRINFVIQNARLMVIWDNSSIHKSKKVKKFFKKYKSSNFNYLILSPSLNPTEKFILYIKWKLNVIKQQEK